LVLVALAALRCTCARNVPVARFAGLAGTDADDVLQGTNFADNIDGKAGEL
jgi:hypothetical protein